MTSPSPTPPPAALPPASAADLIAWYDRHHRRLPWRVGPAEQAAGRRADPYRVWLSEVMLQQTTVAAVKAYFEAFTARWPRVEDLAAAPDEEVMKAWAGLGYYSRARNLKACAERIVAVHGGRFPETAAELADLPGIGPYTAAAIAAIAFDEAATVVDGNVERVVARLFAIEEPMPAAKPAIRKAAATLTPATRPGDFAQATMDLGATICTPRKPACALCPWASACRARAQGIAETLPRRAAKAARPIRTGTCFVAIRADGSILLRRRPPKGLLGGMSEPPGTVWRVVGSGAAEDAATPPLAGRWRRLIGTVAHTFTHFHLELTVMRGEIAAGVAAPEGHWWSAASAVDGEALPSLFRKAIAAARGD
ncbi:A/G-specific adenine glycosylase [Siculibacillus lacustris]|uniref:Adenine DNA glycosylase n=1 Tax=Siculibacillus lacustris TaxID=1549641 RepID=A0A4Q9VI98_9HYPH|nr:A/G-specific adenine glycosylase [Siculibacillus lacustris]TBW34948.1 A/G-specific adenine glycosylase [Siculibacillus lacustris]